MQTLVVEDEASTRRLLEMILRSRGHEVTACADAESAWEGYQQTPYPLWPCSIGSCRSWMVWLSAG